MRKVRLCDAYGGVLWLIKDGMTGLMGTGRMPKPLYEYLTRESVPVAVGRIAVEASRRPPVRVRAALLSARPASSFM